MELDAAHTAQRSFCQNCFMSRIRVLLILLIAFTLPWQGVAAATRVHCATMTGSMTASQTDAQRATPHHGLTQLASDAHPSHALATATAVAGADGATHGKADCSALCCAATISAPVAVPLAQARELPSLPDLPAANASYDPDGFDRPPRT